SVLAKEINDDIKLKQQTLDILESKAQGEVKIKVLSAQESIVVAKIKTEEALSQPELESEINYDLNRQIDKQVNQVLESTELLKNDVKELSIQASEAARSNLTRREEALKKAMAEKNDSLKKEQERLLTLEKIKNQKLSQLEGREAVEVMETVKKAQEAAIRIQKTREQVKEIKSQNTSVSSSANIKD
ncbi:MAG: hypothetical protein Q7R53_00485, partial [bacterium]|nr:hypothetical protein [bacterium]